MQVDELLRVTRYAYEAGEYPDGMDAYTAGFVEGDGGLLNALCCLRSAVCLIPGVNGYPGPRGREVPLEDWHGKAVSAS